MEKAFEDGKEDLPESQKMNVENQIKMKADLQVDIQN